MHNKSNNYLQVVERMIRTAWAEEQAETEKTEEGENEAENVEEPVELSLPAIHLVYQSILYRLEDFTTVARLLPSCLENMMAIFQENADHKLNSTKEMVLPHKNTLMWLTSF